jgi:uncharacterized protein (DUF58 family)
LGRPILLSVLVYSLLFAGVLTLRGELIALAMPLALYLLHGVWRAPDALNLQIDRRLSANRAVPEAPVDVTVTVTNLGREIEELLLEDQISSALTLRLGSTRHVLRLPQGGSYTFAYTVSGPRGNYSFSSVQVEATESLGMISRRQTIRINNQLFVFPGVKRLKSVLIRPRRTRVYAGMIPARLGGVGTEFFGVRLYQAGDPPRSINWRLSARHAGEFFSNEYQQERIADVGIVLDGRQRANLFHGEKSLFEHSVMAAAALADAFLAQGNRVGLLVYSNYLDWTLPGYGKIQRERILQALARSRVGESTVFAGLEHLSPRMFSAESQIVLASPLVYDDLEILVQLRARGYQVMVISPDPVRFERALLQAGSAQGLAARVVRMERDLLIHRLKRAGIQIIEWDVSLPFDQAVGPALTRPHPLAFRGTL